MEHLTPTEQVIYNTLADGRLHKRDDLMLLVGDELMDRAAFRNHIHRLRKKLPNGYLLDAVARSNTIWYRLARHLNGSGD